MAVAGVRGWNDLGIVGTIYEEEYEVDSPLSSPPSSSTVPSAEFTPSPTSWKSGRRGDPDVLIHVQDSCFRLHKDALMARSSYLRRKLPKFPELTLSPPLNITAQTFSAVKDFCYGAPVAVTPSTLAALATAAELLGMTDPDFPGDRNLRQVASDYFQKEVAVNEEYLCIVLRSSCSLLPEAETAAALVSRCLDALSFTAGAAVGCHFVGVKSLSPDDFQMVLESLSHHLTNQHDVLYRIVDLYLKENVENLSGNQKIQLCNYVDCGILSQATLMHAVQNPRMPLRFVVQAMFLQQLSTRRTIISATNNNLISKQREEEEKEEENDTTLGAILQRDAALRQVSHLKAVMNATNSRIHTLEKELLEMRKMMDKSEGNKIQSESARSVSFRLSSEGSSKVERGQRGSVSALNVRSVKPVMSSSSFEEDSSEGFQKVEKSTFGRRFVGGIKSVFGFQKRREGKVEDGDSKGGNGGEGNVVIIKKDRGLHKRSNSQS